MKICKVCGEPNASESRFCINCGSESFEVSDVKQKICPECGSVCEPQFTHCVNCGAALGDANVSGVASIQSGGTVSRDSENTDETAVCPYCGAEISLHTVFCAGCGHDVTAMNRHRVVRRKICRFCGKPNKPEDKFCKYCFFDLRDGETVEFQLDYADAQDKNPKIKQAVLQAPTTEKLKICPNWRVKQFRLEILLFLRTQAGDGNSQGLLLRVRRGKPRRRRVLHLLPLSFGQQKSRRGGKGVEMRVRRVQRKRRQILYRLRQT